MDLIERYLAAVRLLLPRDERDDICAELRDVLMNRREEKAAELGRPLTRQEDEQLLRDFGHPLAVAGRYGRQQYLIGPELYPVYVFVLRIVLVVVAGSALVGGIVSGAVAHGDAGPALRAAFGVAWAGSWAAIGAVTVVFAVLQRTNARLQFLETWNPRDLPKPTRRRRVTWFDHVAAIVVQVIFMLWWTRVIQLWRPFVPLKPGQSLSVDLAPVWHELYWPVLALAAATTVVHALQLFGRAPRRIARALDIAVQFGLLAVAGAALEAGQWVVVAGDGLTSKALGQIRYGINIGLEVTLITVIVVAVGTIAYDAWRLWRPYPGEARA